MTTGQTSSQGGKPLTFGRHQKLKGRVVDHVYKTGKKRSSHPLLAMVLRREDNGPSRLGISVTNRLGSAVVRNRAKRRIREAYRQMQHELPEGFDWLIIVRPHALLTVAGYQNKLRQLLGGL